MDVTFEIEGGGLFTIEVDLLDSILEIKERVERSQGISVHRQTLVYNGQVLEDNQDCEIFLNPRIHLFVKPEPDKPQVNDEKSFPSKKIQLNVNIGSSSEPSVPLEADVNDTVLQLKEKIHAKELLLPPNMLVAQSSGVELQDHRHLRDYGLKDNTEIHITTRPSSSRSGKRTVATAAAARSKRLKVTVLTGSKTKIPMEVNASDNVEELRKELQKLQQSLQESYLFIHKQDVMDEDRSFRWNQVSQGDTIEIFPGYITQGSEKLGRRR